MTIDSAYFIENYTNDGSVEYPFTFEIIDAAYLRVYRVDSLQVYTLIPATDYTAVLNPYRGPISKGGTITLDAPLSSTDLGISIQRKTEIVNDQVFDAGIEFSGEAWEFAVDKLTMILQEIDGTICDCRHVDVPDEFFIWATDLYNSGELFSGYHNGYGMVASDDTGQHIVIAYKGWSNVRVSHDAGLTWSSPIVIRGATTAYPINQISYDSDLNLFFLVAYHGSPDTARDPEYYSSADNGNTWVRFGSTFSSTYAHGMLVPARSNTFRIGTRGSSTLQLGRDVPSSFSTASSVTYATLDQVTTVTGGGVWSSPQSWVPVFIGNLGGVDWFVLGSGGEGGSNYNCVVYNQDHSIINKYPNVLLRSTRIWSRGQGWAICYRTFAGSIVTCDKIPLNDGDLWVGSFPQFTINFGANIAGEAAICYSPGHDNYYAVARDASDDTKFHVAYCIGDNFDTWYVLGSFNTISGANGDGEVRLTWSYGDVFLFARLKSGTVTSEDQFALTKVEINKLAAQIPVQTGVVIHQANFDSNYNVQVGSPNFTVIGSMTIDTTTPKYGIGCLTRSSGASYLTASLPSLDTNNFVFECELRPNDFAAISGIFHYGTFHQTSTMVQAYVGTDGKIQFRKYYSGNEYWNIVASIPLTVLEYNTVRIMCDGYRAYIFVNGALAAYENYIKLTWGSSTVFHLGYATTGPGGAPVNNYLRGRIDNYRLSNGHYERAAYTPVDAPW